MRTFSVVGSVQPLRCQAPGVILLARQLKSLVSRLIYFGGGWPERESTETSGGTERASGTCPFSYFSAPIKTGTAAQQTPKNAITPISTKVIADKGYGP